MQSLTDNLIYLQELGLSERTTVELHRFNQLVRAIHSTWVSVLTLCTIDHWTKGPFTLEEIGENLSHYMEKFMGFSVPANAVRVLPSLAPLLIMNVVGFPLAYARLGHLLNQLEAIQRDWWHSASAVDIVRNYMRGGRKAGFPESMLDTQPFIQRYASVEL
jgi:hypothetical protein